MYVYIHSPATLLGTPVQLLVNATIYQPITWLKFKPSIRMKKKGDLNDFKRDGLV